MIVADGIVAYSSVAPNAAAGNPRELQPAEQRDVTERPRPAHDLSAVGVVADCRVALDRADTAQGRPHDDADVVGQPAVPVEDDEIARLRVAHLPAGGAEP